MSRLTTSEIIAKGEYLSLEFDPKTLIISQLVGIFAYHQIPLPSSYTKAKLIEIYNNTIKANSEELRQQRIERLEALADENGIVDGVTGQQVSPPKNQPTRRSSRRLSRNPSPERMPSESSKRRRASAEPTVGRRTTSRISMKPAPVISEDSESEPEEPPELKLKSEVARSSTRRISQKFGPGNEDSGWEDNNIFQSGTESSSPVRPQRPKVSRKSSLAKSRPSMSAPPESPPRSPLSPISPTKARFTGELPKFPLHTRPWGQPPRVIKEDFEDFMDEGYVDDVSNLADVSAELALEGDVDEFGDENKENIMVEEPEPKDQWIVQPEASETKHVQEVESPTNGAQVNEATIAPAESAVVPEVPTRTVLLSGPVLLRLFVALAIILAAWLVGQYKLRSASIGYCERGSQTNSYLNRLLEKRRAIEKCYSQQGDKNGTELCPTVPLIPLSMPDSCTPCPVHAVCSQYGVKCDDGYALKPHPLSYIPYASSLMNGLPRFGPVAFAPSCVDDELRKKNINVLGKKIDAELARTRGERLCAGINSRKPLDGGEARRWGYRLDELMDFMKRKYVREGDVAKFEELYWEAIPQLRQYGRVIEDIDSEHNRYIASDYAEMSLSCKAIVAARQIWVAWRRSIFGMIGVLVFILYLKAKMATRKTENKRVAELVQIALDTLRNQETNYYSDPAIYLNPYIPSLQLRDLVLQEEHSIPVRTRLWNKVERIVEGNANVRASLEELRSGEEARAWRWVGGSGYVSPAKKRVFPFQSPPRKLEEAGI